VRLRMTGPTKHHPSWWQRITRNIVQEVPVEDGLCEFDCSHLECRTERWQSCENRIRDVRLQSPSESRLRARPPVDWSARIPGMLGAGFIAVMLGVAIYFVFVYLLR
jgi:hypothetical protein